MIIVVHLLRWTHKIYLNLIFAGGKSNICVSRLPLIPMCFLWEKELEKEGNLTK